MAQWFVNTALMVTLQVPFLVALGLHFDVFRRHNFLLGSSYALVLCVLVATLRPLGPALAVSAAFTLGFAILVLSEFLLFAPLERVHRSPDQILIATLGANIVLEQVLSGTFGDRIRFPTAAMGESGTNWFINLEPYQTAIPIGIATLCVVAFVLARTEAGARLVALGENRLLFRAVGFRPLVWQVIALGMIALVLTLSGVAAINVTGAFPTAGFSLVILGFVTRLLGGPVHRLRFALVAAGVVILDQVAAVALPGQWRTLVLFSTLLLLIAIRSRGSRSDD